eukprot:scaffold7693_cov77-Cylindrotheca_fusiformis.AAC.1
MVRGDPADVGMTNKKPATVRNGDSGEMPTAGLGVGLNKTDQWTRERGRNHGLAKRGGTVFPDKTDRRSIQNLGVERRPVSDDL